MWDRPISPYVSRNETPCALRGHEWEERRYYTEKTAAVSSAGAFSEPGEANKERLKKGRWRQDAFCRRCHAWRGSLGLEPTPELYVEHVVEVFREVRRVMRDDGTLWLNVGDSYAATASARDTNRSMSITQKQQARARGETLGDTEIGNMKRLIPPGLKPKDLCGIPWRVAFALQADGWWLRSDIVWAKGRDGDVGETGYGSSMPDSAQDRPVKSHEYLFLLSNSKSYYYDAVSTRVEWKNGAHALRDVWLINTKGFKGAHFATFPEKLVESCIKAGTSERGCCPRCGKPWARVVEKSGGTTGKSWHDHSKDAEVGMTQTENPGGGIGNARDTNGKSYTVQTIGWRPGCGCPTDTVIPNLDFYDHPIPCTVLDPFSGSGTVGLVAARLGRDAILCELNPEYAEMSRKRIKDDSPMFNQVEIQ